MLYKVLGMVVWNGVKFVLRRKYGGPLLPKPVVAGGIVAVAIALGLGARARAAG